MRDRPAPLRKPLRKAAEKPPMPSALEPVAEAARGRHRKRHAQPGVAVELEITEDGQGYRVASPHRDHDAWETMILDALGTRSEATGIAFLYQLTELCTEVWHPPSNLDDPDARGCWAPDETELNLILNFVSGTKPKNEMAAALAAQMVASHLLAMRLTRDAMQFGRVDPRTAAVAGKLMRTFAMQTEAMARLNGRKTTRQIITVRNERHEHRHQHIHFEGGGVAENGGQPREPCNFRNGRNRLEIGDDASRPALPCPDSSGVVVPMPGREGEEALPHSRRRERIGSAKG